MAAASAAVCGQPVAGHDQRGFEGGHLVQQVDPGGAVVGGGGVGDPDVLLLEEQDAAEDGAVLGLPQVVAVGQCRRAALELEAWPSKVRSPVSGVSSTSRVGRFAPRAAHALSLPS